MRNQRIAWVEQGRIVTRNADGGTTGWTLTDARELHRLLGEMIEVVPPSALDEMAAAAGPQAATDTNHGG